MSAPRRKPDTPDERPPFVWADGVRLVGTSLYFEARRLPGATARRAAQATLFVASAASPRARGERTARVLATERTQLLRIAATPSEPAAEAEPGSKNRQGEGARGMLITPFCRPFALGRLRLELLPSGHLPGAAQLLVELGGRRLCYAGALNPQPGRLAEAPQVRGCDALVIDAPLAPLGPLPPRAQVEAALVAAVQQTCADGATPLVLAPLLGAAAEVAALLAAAGVPCRVPARLGTVLDAYARLGLLTAPPRLRGAPARGEAVVWPLEAHDAPAPARWPEVRRLLAGAAALAPDAAARFGAVAAFPLSDHGDLPALVAHAQAAGARDLFFTRGLDDHVARACAAAGLRARPLGDPRLQQMALAYPA